MRRLILVVGLVVVVVACGGSAESTKYKQTWTKAYGETTCADWYDRMDEHQKFVMAADILLTSQRKVKADAPIPDDALITRFGDLVSGLCLTHQTDDVPTVAFIVWTTRDDLFAPK